MNLICALTKRKESKIKAPSDTLLAILKFLPVIDWEDQGFDFPVILVFYTQSLIFMHCSVHLTSK